MELNHVDISDDDKLGVLDLELYSKDEEKLFRKCGPYI
jgi:hypothetical protein